MNTRSKFTTMLAVVGGFTLAKSVMEYVALYNTLRKKPGVSRMQALKELMALEICEVPDEDVPNVRNPNRK